MEYGDIIIIWDKCKVSLEVNLFFCFFKYLYLLSYVDCFLSWDRVSCGVSSIFIFFLRGEGRLFNKDLCKYIINVLYINFKILFDLLNSFFNKNL